MGGLLRSRRNPRAPDHFCRIFRYLYPPKLLADAHEEEGKGSENFARSLTCFSIRVRQVAREKKIAGFRGSLRHASSMIEHSSSR